MRTAEISRKTRETDIKLVLNVDGAGVSEISTGVGFFDHMLDAFSRFALMDLTLRCEGDLQVDAHHTVEDCGICLGDALKQALGNRAGIRRTGSAWMPMDEALAFAAVDISGRPYLAWKAEFMAPMAVHAGLTLHLKVEEGRNDHHKMEALFKAFGLALRDAAAVDSRVTGVLSTKGALD